MKGYLEEAAEPVFLDREDVHREEGSKNTDLSILISASIELRSGWRLSPNPPPGSPVVSLAGAVG